jgi:hypothetical protein
MSTSFEIAIRPDAGKLRTVYFSIVVSTVVAWICHVIGNIYWDEYSYMVTNLKGQTYPSGWPVKLYWWGLYIGICGPIAFVLVQLMNDTKNPSLGVSQDGLYVNQQLIKQTLIRWDNVSRIDRSEKSGNISMSVYFTDPSKIVDAQQGMRKAFVRENLKDGKPLVVESRFSNGDFNALAHRAAHYLSGR